MDTSETHTTTKSSMLNAERRKAPSCRNTPYVMVLSSSSVEKIEVKK